ncbi:hypothetical protein PU088_000929 [Citrobacter farmeri]|uniref:Uncharacterized protein n=1 Tax=Citrobacter amalonaticus Y19 TaxID=1261127 RepID=A0A0F6REB0_CITAM|nr:hypothetical protein [Citrobacter amalonaticus]AKE58375.1 hypothetical protein F384_04050 [Citrobacter amalonaticus Y19]EKV5653494.1 hypothetical protein [Citrobacter farmeri]
MSTICLAAQRSYSTGEAVWFSYRFPAMKKIVGHSLLWMLGLFTLLVVGLYAHLYWNLRHPMPAPVNASVVKPDTQLSDMHYVYVSKPFPHPHSEPAPKHEAIPAMQDIPINSDESDWQQAPDGNIPQDISRETLPGTDAHEDAAAHTGVSESHDNASLTELFKQALKEQQQDYAQGKTPAPPVDETQDNSQATTRHNDHSRPPLSEKGDRLE